MQILLS